MRFITKAAHRRWVEALFRDGFHDGVDRAWLRQAPLARAWRYLCRLEEAGVIRQWTLDASTVEVEAYFMLESEHEAPLFIAGPHWDAFVEEARQLGLISEVARGA